MQFKASRRHAHEYTVEIVRADCNNEKTLVCFKARWNFARNVYTHTHFDVFDYVICSKKALLVGMLAVQGVSHPVGFWTKSYFGTTSFG